MRWLWFVVLLINIPGIRSIQECVEFAERDENGDCVCQNGYDGDGIFCCVPEDHKVCMVEGDPRVRTMNGDVIPIDLPCPLLVSEIHTMGPDRDETVRIFLAGEFDKHGILNYDYFRAEYDEKYHEQHASVEINKGEIFVNGVKHDKKSKSWLDQGHTVGIEYHPVSERFVLSSMDTTLVHFVRPNITADGGMAHVPGVCIAVDRDSLLYDLGMCNERRRGLQRSSDIRGFPFLQAGVLDYMLRTVASKSLGPPQLLRQCTSMGQLRRQCRSRWNSAIKSCFLLVTHADIKFCVSVTGNNLMDLFHNCLKAHCGIEDGSCNAIMSEKVRKCYDITPDCKTIKG